MRYNARYLGRATKVRSRQSFVVHYVDGEIHEHLSEIWKPHLGAAVVGPAVGDPPSAPVPDTVTG